MKRQNKTVLYRRAKDILCNNEGASIVLVTIISILVVTSVIILSVSVNTLMASADRQYFQDQAYEAAKSMGSALDSLIAGGNLPLDEYNGQVLVSDEDPENLVKVNAVAKSKNAEYFDVIITAKAADEEYVYTLTYFKSGKMFMRVS